MVAPLVQSKMKLLSYDGCAEFLAKDAASFLAFMDNIYSSKELVGMFSKRPKIACREFLLIEFVIAGCGGRFVDLELGYDIMVGYDNLIFGKSPESSDYDGILQTDSRLNLGGKEESSKD